MRGRELTSDELDVLERLPGPPALATIRTTNVWIIEWLHSNDRKTGHLLHSWLQQQRPGWSAYFRCSSKADILAAIERAAVRVRQSRIVPVLHLEAHGDDQGLEGPCGTGGAELLSWDELADPLQHLNLATGCNLVVLVAACTGFAGIKAFYRGPRAPAVALIGPTNTLNESELLNGTKEFYRRWRDHDARLSEIVASVSRETGPVAFEMEPFALLAFEAMVKSLLISLRPEEQNRRTERLRQRVQDALALSAADVENQLSVLPAIPPAEDLQLIWDTLFMIDLWPENRERFGVDMMAVRQDIMDTKSPVLLTSP